MRLGLTVLRFLSAVAVPIVAFIILWLSFEWLRQADVNRGVIVLVALGVGVGGIFALYWAMDYAVNRMPEEWRESVRPWVFVGPALVILSIFLLYPALNTIWLSFLDGNSDKFVGLENYGFVFTDDGMLRAIRNTIIWILVVPSASVGLGLGIAVLADKLRRGEAFAKSLIFLPMAVSFVGASVVFGLIYKYKVFGAQTGLLNGIVQGFGDEPIAWLSQEPWNNLLLMVIMIWMQTGFAMVILSAAIKSVPDDILEAARIDGATEIQVFWRVVLPSILSTVVVVMTTMIITVLKVFDIVFVMTNGESGTEVIAEQMIRWFFRNDHNGRGAAIAVVLFLAIVPVMWVNVKRFRAEEAIR
ncbi:MAG: sugar ABC transporter permease [Actinobacteria bacterium]|nr:sugar ABC transporter permease [Actinomycetota bacterium]MBU1493421.1 sugar ABC transporter permease [Actinomycetota bacterium]MBU1865776.1 sugar ABC transporter permease [Actinomycetota bacterium]